MLYFQGTLTLQGSEKIHKATYLHLLCSSVLALWRGCVSKRIFHSKINKVRPKIGQNTCGFVHQHQLMISYEIPQAFGTGLYC